MVDPDVVVVQTLVVAFGGIVFHADVVVVVLLTSPVIDCPVAPASVLVFKKL